VERRLDISGLASICSGKLVIRKQAAKMARDRNQKCQRGEVMGGLELTELDLMNLGAWGFLSGTNSSSGFAGASCQCQDRAQTRDAGNQTPSSASSNCRTSHYATQLQQITKLAGQRSTPHKDRLLRPAQRELGECTETHVVPCQGPNLKAYLKRGNH
jgi:hypothetical protein